LRFFRRQTAGKKCNARGARIVSPIDDGREVSAREDETAVDRVLQGDVAAFADIVERWQSPLVNLAYRFCRDRGRAEDMAQEAFVRAFRGLAKWRRDGAFSTWLFALATNVYRTETRRIPPRTASIEEIPEPADARHDESAEQADQRLVVRHALHSLPSKYREALVLVYFHGQDVAAAAKSLSLPEGTVKARLSRGRALLRTKLERLLDRPRSGDRHGTR